MKNIVKILTLISLLGITENIQAQIETKKEIIEGNELLTTMDSRIHNTINSLEENCKKTPSIGTYRDTHSDLGSTAPKSHSKPLTTAEICKKNPRILGYKIQIAVVKSKEEADKIRADFRSSFPHIKVEVDASMRPNYKILAGNYFTKESANPDLRKIKALFNSATSVRYRVFCVEAK